MRRRSRLLPALGVVVSLVLASACSTDEVDRRPGDAVTQAEAEALAHLLLRNYKRGGADFVVTAPYSDTAMLTLTGEIDFRSSTGRAQAVTSFSTDRPDDTRTLFFTRDHVWTGDVPGLADALADDGATDAAYLRRPRATGTGGEPLLADVLIEVLLNLSARSADQPDAFLDGGYTWLGQRSIDSRLTSVFSLEGGRTVAVAASGDLLTQFVTPLPTGGDTITVTVTFSDHGSRRLDVPDDGQTAEAGDHPEVAAGVGV